MKPSYPMFTLFLFFSITATQGKTLINSTCRNFTSNYGLCTTSLQAAPASGCASLRGLGMIAIKLVNDNVTDTQCHIKHLLKDCNQQPYIKVCLRDCLHLYTMAINSVKDAMRYYKNKRLDDARVMMSAIMTDAGTCEDGFHKQKGFDSPLTKKNKDVEELGNMALGIWIGMETSRG